MSFKTELINLTENTPLLNSNSTIHMTQEPKQQIAKNYEPKSNQQTKFSPLSISTFQAFCFKKIFLGSTELQKYLDKVK